MINNIVSLDNFYMSASSSSQDAHIRFLKGNNICLQLPVILTEGKDRLKAAGL